MYAALNGHTDSARRLLELGADASIKDKVGNTALDLAREFKKTAVVALLEAHAAGGAAAAPPAAADASALGKELLEAATKGEADRVQRLIDAKADVHWKDVRRRRRRVSRGCVVGGGVRRWQAARAARRVGGRSWRLGVAARVRARVACVWCVRAAAARLAVVSADVRVRSHALCTPARSQGSGRTPLHMAAFYGHTAVIPMLTRAGADINAADVRVAFAAASVAAWAVSAAASADACASGVPARAW